MNLVFQNKNANHVEVCNFLNEKFPRLKDGSGFEVLRAVVGVGDGSGSRALHTISRGNVWFTHILRSGSPKKPYI